MLLSIIILGKKYDLKPRNDVEIIFFQGDDLNSVIKSCKGNYISFIKETDQISDNYIDYIVNKIILKPFDLCFVNYKILYDNDNIKDCTKAKKLMFKPYLGDYIWAYVFNKEKLSELLKATKEVFNETVDKLFVNNTSTGDILYYHNPDGKKTLNYFLTDVKRVSYYKNIIYIGGFISGKFNGYVTWLINLGKCFPNKKITLLYDSLKEVTYERMAKYFEVVKYDLSINYKCDRLITTYSNYYYPKNIIPLENASVFIHGDLSYFYRNSVSPYQDDIYNNYYAVSKTAAEGAVGHLPTDKIEYILNPIKIDKDEIKDHIYLVSTLRGSSKVKKQERFEIFAKALDRLDIPYTWDVFTDTKEGTSINGLTFRHRVVDPLPYVKAADYFVLFSDSESFSYSVVEAVELGVKVIVTPLKIYDELGITNNKNVTIIPFEDFDKPEELDKYANKIFLEKNNKYPYKVKYDFSDYDKVFKD